MPGLRELQHAFFGALGSGAAGPTRIGADLRAAVEPYGTLDADGRVDVYAQMYWTRIVDVLREDFPRVVALVGDTTFTALARRYLAATPSRHPSLRHVGDGFGDFLAHDAASELPPFLADLARLERARLDVFDAPDSDVLTLAALRRVPMENWGGLRLCAIPAFTTLELGWPVHVVWPDDADVGALAAATTTLRVWRDAEYRVFQAPLDAVESAALALVVGGATFADVCGVVAAVRATDDAATQAAALLLRWIDDHVIAALDA